MKSNAFLKVIENVLAKSNKYADTQKLFVFVISPEFPFIVKGFKVHWYKELWFKQIFDKDNSNK